VGEDWIHEVKFDGWRAQVHVEDGEATIFSKNGADLSRRFRALKPVIDLIPAKTAIIDRELVACDEAGLPCLRTLMDHGKNNAPLCLWAFDLLYLNGVGITPLSLTDRKEALAELVSAADSEHLQFSGTFADPIKLLETCAKMSLEGIVSKRKVSAYRSGPTRDWLKIKTTAWRAANRKRLEAFSSLNAR
jgi:bifunctional non-homologous end joining protein LigD